MRKPLLLLPIALTGLLSLTGCSHPSQLPTTTPAASAAPSAPPGTITLGGGATTSTTTQPTPTVTPTATSSSTAGPAQPTDTAERSAAIKALQNWPNDPYGSLGPDLRDKVYTKTTAAALFPKGTTVKARPDTWQPASDTEGEIVADFTYPTGRTTAYDITMLKVDGIWKINFTIFHVD